MMWTDLLFDRNKFSGTGNPSEVQCIVFQLMMSLEFLLLICCADLSTGDQLIEESIQTHLNLNCLLATRHNDNHSPAP